MKFNFREDPVFKRIVEESDAIVKELGAKDIQEAIKILEERNKEQNI